MENFTRNCEIFMSLTRDFAKNSHVKYGFKEIFSLEFNNS